MPIEAETAAYVLVFVAAAAVAGTTSLDPSAGEGSRTPGNDRDIVVIAIDSLRADHLPCYGYHRNTAPNICGLAKDSVVFENVYAQSSWSLPSYLSMLTGEWPTKRNVDTSSCGSDEVELLPEILSRNGYLTGGFVDGGYLNYCLLVQGYDRYISHSRGSGEMGHTTEVVNSSLDFLANHSRPQFVLMHTMEVHFPYRPENRTALERYDPWYTGNITLADDERDSLGLYSGRNLSREDLERLEAGYDASLRYTDAKIGRFLERLERQGRMDDTIIVITSDHGEAFQEDTLHVGHTRHLYQQYIKVPLIVHYPGDSQRRVEERVRLVDLVPTVLDLAGLETGKRIAGRSLLPLVNGTGGDRLVYSSTHFMEWNPNIQTVIANDTKLIWDRGSNTTEVFRLDRGREPRSIQGDEELREKYREIIERLQASRSRRDISPWLRERLEELGYVE